MDKKKNIDELLEAAKASHNKTVQQALKKLLFAVSIAHNREYIEHANSYHFHNGCSITVPQSNEDITMTLVWNDEEIGIHSMGHCFTQFRYGSMLQKGDPMPGVILIEDKPHK